MALVFYAGNIIRGLSTDVKPTNVPEGTLFIETDTLKIFTFSGGSYSESKTDASKLSGIDISSTPPSDGQVLVYNVGTNQWEPQTLSGGGGGGGIANAYVHITDGTNPSANASGEDTFKLRSANNILSITVTDDDATHGDNALFEVIESNINHNNLSNLTTGNPHTQYQLRSEKGVANGYCELDSSVKVPQSRIQEVIGLNDLTDVNFTGTVATGDLLYRTASEWNRLPIGNNGQVLTVVGGLPAWQDPPGGGGGGGLSNAYASITDGTNTAVASGSDTFKLRSSDGSITITVTDNDTDHGDNADLVVNSAMYTPTSRSINTTAPLTGGGNLTADRTISITGLTSLGSANQLAGVNSNASGWEYKTLSGTTGEINVTHGAGTITLSLPNVGTAGTYTKVTTDAKGRVSSGEQAQFSDIGGTASKTQLPSSVAYEDEANTFTDTQRFDSTIVIPRKTDPATPSIGELWVNDTDLKYRDNQTTPATHIVEVQDNKGVANGYCELDSSAKVPASRITEVIGLSDLNDVTLTGAGTGDILYKTTTVWDRLPIGADGQVLTVSGGLPSWQNPSGGIGGSGTANFIPVFTSSSAVGDSIIYQQPIGTQFTGIGVATGAGGVGTAFHILKDGTTSNSLTNAIIRSEGYSSSDNIGIEFWRARGTKTAPSAILANDKLGYIDFYGHIGSAFVKGASIQTVASANWTSYTSTDLIIQVVHYNTMSMVDRFRIKYNGSFEFVNIDSSVIMTLNDNGKLGVRYSINENVPTINFYDGTIYSNTGIFCTANTILGFTVMGNKYAEFTSSQLRLNTTISLYIQKTGTESDPAILFSNSGFFVPSGGTLSVTTGSPMTERYMFDSNGDLIMKGDYKFVPSSTNTGKVGTSNFKFAEVNAVVVNAGDFRFANGYYLTEDYENGGIKLCRPDGSVVTRWR